MRFAGCPTTPPSLRAGASRLFFAGLVFSLLWAPRAWAGGRNMEGVVNLNTASVELLSLLPGIGPSKASGIIGYRARRPFRTVDELVRVKGIGRRMVREIRAHLAVAGPSTARGLGGVHLPAKPSPPPPPPTAPVRPLCRPAVTFPARGASAGRSPPGRDRRLLRTPANHCIPPL